MRHTIALTATIFLSSAVFSFAAGMHLTGRVISSEGSPLEDAVVSVTGIKDWSFLRTRSALDGTFSLDSAIAPQVVTPILPHSQWGGADAFLLPQSTELRLSVLGLDGSVQANALLTAQAGLQRLHSPAGALTDLAPGLYIIRLSNHGQVIWSGTAFQQQGAAAPSLEAVSGQASLRKQSGPTVDTVVVRLAGYLTAKVPIAAYEDDLGDIQLAPDPIEARVTSVLAVMTLDQKASQMVQALTTSYPGTLGSLLAGGDDPLPTGSYNTMQNNALSSGAKIPMIFGIDAVHGNAKASGATILPHNIGLGATRDPELMQRLGTMVAAEVRATDVDWSFAPCVAVARDIHWGRTYESFGERPELAASLGSAFIRGLQGDSTTGGPRVLASAKHFLADGGTDGGDDQGNATLTEEQVRATHLPGYIAAIEAGVGSVMASYSSINGTRNHGNGAWLTDVLKKELGFDGFVIGDYDGIEQLSGSYSLQVATAINAGVDMAMAPTNSYSFPSTLKTLVQNGQVSTDRVDDAVRRILRIKFRMGLFDHPLSWSDWDSDFGSPTHRELAREAVRKSVVVLRNRNSVLPLSKQDSVRFVGSSANNAGRQCGGWTLGWQGISGTVNGATTIYAGAQTVGAKASYSYSAVSATGVNVIVTGEAPYAEYMGDAPPVTGGAGSMSGQGNLTLPTEGQTLVDQAAATGQPVVLVVVSGRPLVIPEATLAKVDALVAAWLPGSEGAGVSDILFGDYAPTGTLPITWPASLDQIPIHSDDSDIAGNPPAFGYGDGLTW